MRLEDTDRVGAERRVREIDPLEPIGVAILVASREIVRRDIGKPLVFRPIDLEACRL